MNLNEIQDLIKFVAKSGVSEVEIEQKDFKIVIKSEGKSKSSDQPVYIQAAAPVPAAHQSPPYHLYACAVLRSRSAARYGRGSETQSARPQGR